MAEQNIRAKEDSTTEDTIQRIIVIGGSSGGFEAFKTIIKNLPPNFQPPVFIVWHMSPDVLGVLPTVLDKLNVIPAAHAYDGEPIVPHRIYVAPPDHHMLIEDGRIRITHGPKENRFRPAIDPLFRSAAYVYGHRVIGIILSGALDDGTAGLWRVKWSEGVAIVQDPADAEVPSMPQNAMREVEVDYCVPVSDMAALLTKLSGEILNSNPQVMKDEKTKIEIDIAAENDAFKKGSLFIGELSALTCPECHGVLSRVRDGNLLRFRCHTGHAFSMDSLVLALDEAIEESLYNAIRGIDEEVILLNHIGDHFAEANHPQMAAQYFQKAQEAMERSIAIRDALFSAASSPQNKLLQQPHKPAI